MRMVDLIAKKRDGGELTPQEINFIIERYTDGTIPDYQMSAFAMAVFFRGMTKPETAELTDAMARSGEMISLDSIPGVKVDKHSTGGVGDTTTLILAPLAAAAGIPVAKMSGRGLGHTGGTLDKLESIPGFNVELTSEQFIRQVNSCGVAVIGQTGNLTPADKMLYGLRDVTATVDSIPMIAASIMSKKIAAGADAIVLDVKTGSGAFMKSVEEAEELAHTMVDIGKALNRRTTAVISDMSQPLGFAIGNSLEVAEAIQTLQGEGPDDLTKLSLTLGANMLVLGGKTQDFEEAYALLEQLIRSGAALDKFKQLIAAQGGDPSVVDQPERLPRAKQAMEVTASKSGYVHAIQAEEIGIATMMLGAGRETKDAIIDLAVGIELRKKIGQHVRQGETIAIIHANSQETEAIERKIINAYSIQPQPCESPQLIHRVIPSL